MASCEKESIISTLSILKKELKIKKWAVDDMGKNSIIVLINSKKNSVKNII